MKLKEAIEKLQKIETQKPNIDFDFVWFENGYGIEVKDIWYDSEHERIVITATDQD